MLNYWLLHWILLFDIEDFVYNILNNKDYHKELVYALRDYVDLGNVKYILYNDKIYRSVFKEDADEYRRILKLSKEDDERRVEFDRLRGYENGKKNPLAETATYGEVKAWFLLNFPEIEEYNKKTEELRNKIREENENKKVA